MRLFLLALLLSEMGWSPGASNLSVGPLLWWVAVTGLMGVFAYVVIRVGSWGRGESRPRASHGGSRGVRGRVG